MMDWWIDETPPKMWDTEVDYWRPLFVVGDPVTIDPVTNQLIRCDNPQKDPVMGLVTSFNRVEGEVDILMASSQEPLRFKI